MHPLYFSVTLLFNFMSIPPYRHIGGLIDHDLEKLALVHVYLDRILARHCSQTLDVFYYHEIILSAFSTLVSKYIHLFI